MTTERAYIVPVAPTDEVRSLVDDMQSAAERARKADPGDRSDVVRFESLATQLEHLAAREQDARVEVPIDVVEGALLLGTDESNWSNVQGEARAAAMAVVEQGHIPVLVIETFGEGDLPLTLAGDGVPPVAARWVAEDGVEGSRAVEARFRSQLEEALEAGRQGAKPRPISPSGIQNAVVTEILREFVVASSGEEPVDAPVEYRDGSRSEHTFPLRSLKLRSESFASGERDLHLALLSIRHTEMDAVVHGAWLRNAEVSRPRPAALTDDLVYKLSRTQLQELTSREPSQVRIHMYQTGLETAVVGFYRALADHLLECPGTVAVQPMYFRKSHPIRSDGITTNHAPFRRGTPWWM